MDISQPHQEAGGSGDPYPITQSNIAVAASSQPSAQPVVLMNSLCLAPQGVQSDVYVRANTKLTSAYGHIVSLQAREERRNPTPDAEAIDRFNQKIGMEVFDHRQRGNKRKLWFFFVYGKADLHHEHFDYLSTLCDVVALGKTALGKCTALCHRSNAQALELDRFVPGTFYAPCLYRRKNANDLSFRFVSAWVQGQQHIMSNFFVATPDDYDETHVLTEWEGRTRQHVLADINTCKNTDKLQRTLRQNYISNCHARLFQMWLAEETERESPRPT